jgi:hypothetical protein
MSPLKPVVVKTRRITIILVAAAALALPFGAYLLGHRVTNNCESVNRIVDAGVKILDSPANMKRAYEAGRLSEADYMTGLAQIKRFDPLRQQNIKDWRKARCK